MHVVHPYQNEKYDVIIVGSGLGGLLCATLIAMQGKKVCVLEKNKQLGGNLQTFSRNKKIFDTGVHYIGGLGEGQTLHQIFKYAGLMDKLRLQKMDEGFDKILIGNDAQQYVQSQGYDAFLNNLVKDFPTEKNAIEQYCLLVKEVCSSFPLYHLKLNTGAPYKGNDQSAATVIASITNNKKLQAVLAGNHLLYAGVADKTPFHVHALIINSYIESSWKCIDGGSQISKILAANIKALGGSIYRNCEVTKFVETDGLITHVETSIGKNFCADNFISNIAPQLTLQLAPSKLLKDIYRNRIQNLEQTISAFSLHIVLKEQVVPYQNCNYYYHKTDDVWSANNYTDDNWPLSYGLYFMPDRANKKYAATISILAPMRFADVQQWAHTYNRVGREGRRSAGYTDFKERKTAQLLNMVQQRFPWLQENIKACYSSTPLTNRDYIGDSTGSMYGIQKDYTHPLKTMISPRTKIANLFLTGQNLNLHGILGTSLSAALTCSLLLNDDTLVDKIRNA